MLKKFLSSTLAIFMCLSPSVVFANTNSDLEINRSSITTGAVVNTTVENNNYKSLLNISSSIDQSKSNEFIDKNLNKAQSIKSDVGGALLAGLQKPAQIKNSIQAVDANTHKPIANLKYVVMNPESLKNGKFTVNTQIAWLWSYNGENYSYDPDGYKITERNISGTEDIKEAVKGFLTGDIGFVTQFKAPGEYLLKFKCKNEKNVWSNEWSIAIPIEPTDNNTRPQCVVNYSPTSGDTNTQFAFTWVNSKDNDANDSITNYQIVTTKDGVDYPISSSIVGQTGIGIVLKFKDPGEYKLMFRARDTHGAWSNWAVATINVSGAK